MRLIAKAVWISHAKFHRNKLTIVHDIQDYANLIFGTQCTGRIQGDAECNHAPCR